MVTKASYAVIGDLRGRARDQRRDPPPARLNPDAG